MKIGVIGCGSIGKRHLTNLLKFDDIELYVSDISKNTLKSIKEDYNIEVFTNELPALSVATITAMFVPSEPAKVTAPLQRSPAERLNAVPLAVTLAMPVPPTSVVLTVIVTDSLASI